MKITDYVETLAREGALLAAAAGRAGVDATVPTCPRWRVRDLLGHTGAVHRWAAGFVREALTEPVPFPDLPEPADDEVLPWYREGHAALVRTLAGAPADLRCWTFLPDPPSAAAFWARRQAHETTVHRMDAQAALGVAFSPVEPGFAQDGVDELLTGFHARPRSRVRTPEPRVLRVRAADTGAVWTVRLSSEPPRTVRGDADPADPSGPAGAPDCEVTGDAAWLYAALWNRLPLTGPGVTGDLSLARLWSTASAI
ncbi:maleylpyruvate isomerase family mycothiol-dependent enzyme [Streptomyces sp. NPDC051567]|uniref:maleylpyruvate isomerase family mycothiol-dependent enzyme n=1 Tax=Streptomyces sp. NPDC051567 TaxID=3365660 RepID=UPI0037AEDDA4